MKGHLHRTSEVKSSSVSDYSHVKIRKRWALLLKQCTEYPMKTQLFLSWCKSQCDLSKNHNADIVFFLPQTHSCSADGKNLEISVAGYGEFSHGSNHSTGVAIFLNRFTGDVLESVIGGGTVDYLGLKSGQPSVYYLQCLWTKWNSSSKK